MSKYIQNNCVWLTAMVAIGCGATQGCELRPLPGLWTGKSPAASLEIAPSAKELGATERASASRPLKTVISNSDVRAVEAGELMITEIMSRSLLLDDSIGEYLEVAYLGPPRRRFPPLFLRLPDGRKVSLSSHNHIIAKGRVWLVRSTRKQRLRLPNVAGRIELWAGETLVDVAQYTSRWPWPRRKAGVALCRFRVDVGGDRGRAWRRCRQRLRHVERGSPGQVARLALWVAGHKKSRSSNSKTRRRRLSKLSK